MRLQCNLKGPELFLEGCGEYVAAGVQGPLKGPGSSGVIDALWCNLSLILDHLQFVWNLLYYTECNQIEAWFILSMIKKRNKQQSLAGRIDKLGGPEFENPYLWQKKRLDVCSSLALIPLKKLYLWNHIVCNIPLILVKHSVWFLPAPLHFTINNAHMCCI